VLHRRAVLQLEHDLTDDPLVDNAADPVTAPHAPDHRAGTPPVDLDLLLRRLADDAFTGLVRVGEAGELWLADGGLYLAGSRTTPPPFDVLLAAEVVSWEELETLCADADRDGPPVLGRLLASHPEAEARLRRVLHEHLLAALFELLIPSDEPVRIEAGATHVVGAALAEPVPVLLATAAERVEVWRGIARRIPTTALRFGPKAAPEGDGRTVSADEWAVLALLDGRRTVADVIAASGLSAFRVCSMLYRLSLDEVVVPIEAAAA
jgi:hypothetical protein